MTGAQLPRRSTRRRGTLLCFTVLLTLVTLVTGLPGLIPAMAITRRASAATTSTTVTAISNGSTTTTSTTSPNESGSKEPSDPRAPDEMLRLADQTDWVAPESTFRMVLNVSNNLEPDTRLAVRFYDKVSGRIRFSQSIDGGGLGSPIQPILAPTPIAEIPRDGMDRLIVEVPVSQTSVPESGIRLTSPGVYPVSVAITDVAGRELDSFITYLIRTPEGDEPGPTLAVSVIVPVHAPPARQPDGSVTFSESDVARLDSLTQSMNADPTLPLTVIPTPETVDSLDSIGTDGGDGTGRYDSILSRLRSSSTGRQVISSPYVQLDLGSGIYSEMDGWVNTQLDRGSETLSTTLGSPTDGLSWIVDETVTPEALDLLHSRGVQQLVIPSDLLSDPPTPWSDVTFTNTFDVTTANNTAIRAVGADSELADRLDSTPDPVLNAHIALADLAVLYFDRPSRSRGVVLLLPPDVALPQATLDAFFNGLGRNGSNGTAPTNQLVSAVTLDDLFRVTDPAGIDGVVGDDDRVLVRDYTSDKPMELSTLRSDLSDTNGHLDGLRSMVGDAPEVIDPLENQMLVAGALGIDSARSHAYLEGVNQQVDAIASGVTAPPRQVVTLTARTARIPLAIDNHLGYPVRVKVHLISEKLVFPDGDMIDVTLPAASTTRMEISVEARVSGAFPVDVNLTSPDNSLSFGSTRLTVRSIAFSGLGLALSISAGLFLAIWWLRHFRGTRRARRLIASEHPSMGPWFTDSD